MLRLVSLCLQKMFYELSVILTDLFQNKKTYLDTTVPSKLTGIKLLLFYNTMLSHLFYSTFTKSNQLHHRLFGPTSECKVLKFLHTQIKKFPLDTSEIKLNV